MAEYIYFIKILKNTKNKDDTQIKKYINANQID